jgi:hypothetical protein
MNQNNDQISDDIPHYEGDLEAEDDNSAEEHPTNEQ